LTDVKVAGTKFKCNGRQSGDEFGGDLIENAMVLKGGGGFIKAGGAIDTSKGSGKGKSVEEAV